MDTYQFYDIEHAKMYLSGSIVQKVDGDPIYILGVERLGTRNGFSILYVNDLKKGWDRLYREKDIRGDLLFDKSRRDISLTPIRTGLCNVMDRGVDVQLISRTPNRGWKIGLCSKNSVFANYPSMNVVQNRNALKKGFVSMVKNKYPTIKECRNRIKLSRKYESRRDINIMAFSREFAIDYENRVYSPLYRKGEIGTYITDEEDILLKDKAFFFKEQLENMGIPCRL